ncbi:MAG: carboxypeptidase-like regulatory domain-containing protein [Pyrinomonadaceae bacterium]|nr:carboxypeptidase-like regulatory domain-containing protein [Pyrinomonadaceae bacterium]
MPNSQNTSVNLASKTANIVVEQGESVTCTFASTELVPTSAPASVTGRVVSESGTGIRNAKVKITDALTGVSTTVSTNSFGYYTIDGLSTGRLYTLSASAKRIAFTPDSMSFALDMDMFDMNFTARSGK